MGLPAFYYFGKNDPPHPEIWIHYFLRMVELYSGRVCELAHDSGLQSIRACVSHLNKGEKALLKELLLRQQWEFAPVEQAALLGVTNKTVINRCARLASNGLLIPLIVKSRIRTYQVSDYAIKNREAILSLLNDFSD